MTNNSTPQSGGTLRWQAPELLGSSREETETHQCNTKATDIYAYACLCYEMFAGHQPFYHIRNFFNVLPRVKKGIRPHRPSDKLCRARGLNDEIWNLVEDCWSSDPKQRPAAADVLKRLRELPDKQLDQRPPDDFRRSFPSQMLYMHAEHPFSVLAIAPLASADGKDGTADRDRCQYSDFVHWPFQF